MGGAVGLELGQGLGLDLADALARDAELPAHLFESERGLAPEAETQLDDPPLALREEVERAPELLPCTVSPT